MGGRSLIVFNARNYPCSIFRRTFRKWHVSVCCGNLSGDHARSIREPEVKQSMQFAPRTFSVDDVPFTVTFGAEGAYVVATLRAGDPKYALLADSLTAAWKLFPVELVESLCDRRFVRVGEFYSIMYGDADDGADPDVVSILDDEEELDVNAAFFSSVVIGLAKTHLAVVGQEHFPWFNRLTPAAKAKIT